METQTKQCKHCKEQINKIASRCPKCGGKNYVWTTSKKLVLCIVLFFVLVGVLGSSGGSKSTTTLSTPETSDSSAKSGVRFGESGYLYLPGQTSGIIELGTTKDNASEIVRLVVANDTLGLAKMVTDNKAFLVDQGILVKVIDESFGLSEVRILQGKYLGESGWVPFEFIFKEKK